ncbi:hypothetical protein L9Z41_16320 [Leptospira noguchii]|nr:hypothetical protein [Leptospira noguchii]MCH1917151.1 hypothetical protein [Leptospira noguchii]UOG62881.1 hypothetical protein MAL04_10630 [Leptospira noguchii]
MNHRFLTSNSRYFIEVGFMKYLIWKNDRKNLQAIIYGRWMPPHRKVSAEFL